SLCSYIPFSNSPCGYRYFLPLMSPEPTPCGLFFLISPPLKYVACF
ncbi:hypothetical protein DESPIG_02594, partial [Desulfovibrio piger ATCC 29098]